MDLTGANKSNNIYEIKEEKKSGLPGIEELDLFGIFGNPLTHTLSPAFQEAGLHATGLLAHYLVFDFRPAVFKKTMKSLRKLPLKGFNLTIPYKQDIIPYLDWITDEARAIGAVNTVYRFGKKWYGTNTDAEGFWRSIHETWKAWKPQGKSALILGAGGASRAVIYALAKRGVKTIAISNRTEIRSQELIEEFKHLFPKTNFFSTSTQSKKDLEPFEMVINTTSVGLKKKDKSILPNKVIPTVKKKYFIDLIYNPSETTFLKLARKKGHHTLNGLPMLLYQGTRAFEIWTGHKAPVKVMKKALEAALKESVS